MLRDDRVRAFHGRGHAPDSGIPAWLADHSAKTAGHEGFQYKSKMRGSLSLKPGIDGKAPIKLVAKGAGAILPPLPIGSFALRVQLNGGGNCWRRRSTRRRKTTIESCRRRGTELARTRSVRVQLRFRSAGRNRSMVISTGLTSITRPSFGLAARGVDHRDRSRDRYRSAWRRTCRRARPLSGWQAAFIALVIWIGPIGGAALARRMPVVGLDCSLSR